eukprot:GILK01000875.1.p1 GENE.GILK01000875.1~~GILK01000875.1.p1  ORF type:complete len:203 (+),score=40.74 GILK01000875.1:67-675(+)
MAMLSHSEIKTGGVARSNKVPYYKMVVLGSGGVGKSALTIRLLTDSFLDEYDPTIEDNYRKQVVVDNDVALLDILDTAGQEEFSCMQDQWMREGRGFVLVYSITSRSSFEEMAIFREKILRVKDVDNGIPIVLIGNKCDQDDMRAVKYEEGRALAELWGCKFMEASAKLKINHEEGFFEIVRAIRREDEAIPPKKRLWCSIL